MIGVLCFVAPTAQAAYVTLDLQVDEGGTFDLYASTPLADSYGISFFSIDLENILTATHTSPTGMDLDAGYISRGFTGGGSDLTGDGPLFAYQDVISSNGPDSLIYGLGQTAGSFTTLGNPRGMPWTAAVKIATGTWDIGGSAPNFGNEVHVNVFAKEWTSGPLPGGFVEGADVVLIPEAQMAPPLTTPPPSVINEPITVPVTPPPSVIDEPITVPVTPPPSVVYEPITDPVTAPPSVVDEPIVDPDDPIDIRDAEPDDYVIWPEPTPFLGTPILYPFDGDQITFTKPGLVFAFSLSDHDGDVDGVGFGLWQMNYSTNVGAGAIAMTTTPEPATLGLLLIGSLALFPRRLRPR